MQRAPLSKEDILLGMRRLDELASTAYKRVELSVYGGAAIVLCFNGVRQSTYDVDVVIRDGCDFVRQVAKKIADENAWPENWLNDAVKGFVAHTEDLRPLSAWGDKEIGLVVQVAAPEYLLAMKCMSMRLDADSHDIEDIQTLLHVCGLSKLDDVLDLVEKFYPARQSSPKVSLGVRSLKSSVVQTRVCPSRMPSWKNNCQKTVKNPPLNAFGVEAGACG